MQYRRTFQRLERIDKAREARRLIAGGMTAIAAAKALNVSRTKLYRALAELEALDGEALLK